MMRSFSLPKAVPLALLLVGALACANRGQKPEGGAGGTGGDAGVDAEAGTTDGPTDRGEVAVDGPVDQAPSDCRARWNFEEQSDLENLTQLLESSRNAFRSWQLVENGFCGRALAIDLDYTNWVAGELQIPYPGDTVQNPDPEEWVGKTLSIAFKAEPEIPNTGSPTAGLRVYLWVDGTFVLAPEFTTIPVKAEWTQLSIPIKVDAASFMVGRIQLYLAAAPTDYRGRLYIDEIDLTPTVSPP